MEFLMNTEIPFGISEVKSSTRDGLVSLKDYLAGMKDGQETRLLYNGRSQRLQKLAAS